MYHVFKGRRDVAQFESYRDTVQESYKYRNSRVVYYPN